MQPFVISYLCLFYYKMFAVKRVFSSLLNDCCFFAWLPMWGNKGCKNYIMSSDFYILLSLLLIKVTYCTHLLTGLRHIFIPASTPLLPCINFTLLYLYHYCVPWHLCSCLWWKYHVWATGAYPPRKQMCESDGTIVGGTDIWKIVSALAFKDN